MKERVIRKFISSPGTQLRATKAASYMILTLEPKDESAELSAHTLISHCCYNGYQ